MICTKYAHTFHCGIHVVDDRVSRLTQIWGIRYSLCYGSCTAYRPVIWKGEMHIYTLDKE